MDIRYNILKLLRSRDDFVSGEEIGGLFNISRTAVWKHIDRLKSEGYKIDSVKNRGYKLLEEPDVINEGDITEGLDTAFIGRNVLCFPSLDSTNNKAKELAESGAADGTVVFAEEQTMGKGRRGRAWSLEAGKCIAMSIILRPDTAPVYAAKTTLIMGLAACEVLRRLSGAEVGIKWPNDIVINGKKICGILTEMSTEDEYIRYIVCGIGINVGQTGFPKELERLATSLYIESGQRLLRKNIAKALLECFEEYYLKYISGKNAEEFAAVYKKYCINIGKRLRAIYDDREITGTGADINSSGELIILDEYGKETVLRSGEVSVRGVYE